MGIRNYRCCNRFAQRLVFQENQCLGFPYRNNQRFIICIHFHKKRTVRQCRNQLSLFRNKRIRLVELEKTKV